MAQPIEALAAFIGLSTKELEAGLARAQKKMAAAGEKMQKVGGSLTKFVTLPLLAVGVASIKMAADAEEAESLFTVAFDGMAKSARDWSEDLAERLGISAFRLRENSAQMNVMVKSMGLSEKAAFEMSTEMAALAEDMASFFNLRPEEAFQKLRAGITGEAEPLKALGILIDENTIQQAAYSAGIAKTGEKLTQLQKVEARRIAIMQQTKLAQGDLARTADSLSNRFKSLQARTSDMMIELGQIFIPIAKQLVTVLLDVISKVREGIARFKGFEDGTKKMILGTLAFVVALGPLLAAIGSLVVAFAGMLPFIAKGFGLIVQFLPLLKGFALVWGVLALKIIVVVGLFVGIIVLVRSLMNDVSLLGDIWKTVWNALVAGFKFQLLVLTKGLRAFVGLFSTDFASKLDGAVDALTVSTGKSFDKMASGFSKTKDKLAQGARDLKDELGTIFAGGTLGQLFTGSAEAPSPAGGAAPGGGAGAGAGGAPGAPGPTQAETDELFERMSAIAAKNIETTEAMTETWFGFQANWNSMWEQMSTVTSSAFQSFTDGFGQAVADSLVFGQNFAESMKKLMQNIAADVIKMLIKIGLERVAQAVIHKATAATTATVAGIAGKAQVGVAANIGGANVSSWMASNPFTAAAAVPAGLAMKTSILSSFGALATGGVTTGPTIAEIGEKGQEAVVPLTGARGRKAMAGIGGGGTITIIQELDSEVLSRAVVEGSPEIIRAEGGVAL